MRKSRKCHRRARGVEPPPLRGGMQGGSKDCTGRTSTAAHTRSSCHGSCQAQGPRCTNSPSCSWDSCGVGHHPCSHPLSRAKLGRGMGMCRGCRGLHVRLWRVAWGEVLNYFPIHTSHCQSHMAKLHVFRSLFSTYCKNWCHSTTHSLNKQMTLSRPESEPLVSPRISL